MQILKPTIAIIHDARRSKSNGLYPIKLRITFARVQRFYQIGVDASKADFNLIQDTNAIKSVSTSTEKRRLNELKLKCDSVLVKATTIADKLDDFTFRLFERIFFRNELSIEDVYAYYDDLIKQINKEGRLGTASNYQSSLSSLRLFKAKLSFRDVTVDFLKEYEKWLLSEEKSITTVGVYLRPLRAVLNQAISDGIISREAYYPFGKRKYQIPSSKNIKKALQPFELKKIFEYKPLSGTWWAKARDFFIFSYLCNGINMKDILQLRYSNIDGEYLRFNRAKTLHTNRANSGLISIFMTDEVKAIIERWHNPSKEPEDFLFPFLKKHLTPEKEQATIKQFTRMINTYLKLIVDDLKIDKHVTTYHARHSFATMLKRNGTSTELISESLGHSNLKTTASYLDSFDDETKKQLQIKLMNFNIVPND